MTPKQFFLIVFAHRYIAAGAFVLVFLAGIIVTLVTPKGYVATTDLLIDARTDPIAGAATTGQSNYLPTQLAIIQSDRTATEVVKRLKIAENPELVEKWKKATEEKSTLDSYYSTGLRKNLQVEPLRGSNVVRLTFEGGDPVFVADVANAFAQSYLELTVDLRTGPAKQYSEWFDDRIKTLRNNVEIAQKKLSEYQRKAGIVGNDQRADIETQRLDALMGQLVSIQGDNIAMTSRQKTSGGELSPDVQASPVVQGIKTELTKTETKLSEISVSLGPNHPQRIQLQEQVAQLKSQLEQEMRRVSGGTLTAKETAGLREDQLRGVIAGQKSRVLALKAERDQVAVLTQDVEAAKQIYDSVLQRSNQMNLEKQTDQANVSILSPATVPSDPSRPNIPRYLFLSFVAALAAGFASAIGKEMLNRKVRIATDIEIDGVPVLGIIEQRATAYTWAERFMLFKKFFTQRQQRKEYVAASRLASL